MGVKRFIKKHKYGLAVGAVGLAGGYWLGRHVFYGFESCEREGAAIGALLGGLAGAHVDREIGSSKRKSKRKGKRKAKRKARRLHSDRRANNPV